MHLNENFFTAGVLPARNYRFVLGRNTALTRECGLHHGASSQMTALMGEAMLGAFFIATYAAKNGDLIVSIQMECAGPARRIIAFASNNGDCRSYALSPDAVWGGSLEEGKGAGVLSVNRWRDGNRKLYTSAVEMRDASIAENISDFVKNSDQVAGFIDIRTEMNADGVSCVSGYLFEALPEADEHDREAIRNLIGEREPERIIRDMLGDSSGGERISGGLRRAESVKILSAGSFRRYCDCTSSKIENMLLLLGAEELREILNEKGFVEIFCEFCKKRYYYEQKEIEELLNGQS